LRADRFGRPVGRRNGRQSIKQADVQGAVEGAANTPFKIGAGSSGKAILPLDIGFSIDSRHIGTLLLQGRSAPGLHPDTGGAQGIAGDASLVPGCYKAPFGRDGLNVKLRYLKADIGSDDCSLKFCAGEFGACYGNASTALAAKFQGLHETDRGFAASDTGIRPGANYVFDLTLGDRVWPKACNGTTCLGSIDACTARIHRGSRAACGSDGIVERQDITCGNCARRLLRLRHRDARRGSQKGCERTIHC